LDCDLLNPNYLSKPWQSNCFLYYFKQQQPSTIMSLNVRNLICKHKTPSTFTGHTILKVSNTPTFVNFIIKQ
jgi:hypothetical protein